MRSTSLKAYEELKDSGQISERHLIILNVLYQSGGYTDWEIARKLGKTDPNYCRPRRKELFDLHLVQDFGKRTCSVTGKTAHVWGCTKYIPELSKHKQTTKQERQGNACAFCGGTGVL